MTFIIGVMSGYQLAQLNIGVIKGAMDSPVMAGRAETPFDDECPAT